MKTTKLYDRIVKYNTVMFIGAMVSLVASTFILPSALKPSKPLVVTVAESMNHKLTNTQYSLSDITNTQYHKQFYKASEEQRNFLSLHGDDVKKYNKKVKEAKRIADYSMFAGTGLGLLGFLGVGIAKILRYRRKRGKNET